MYANIKKVLSADWALRPAVIAETNSLLRASCCRKRKGICQSHIIITHHHIGVTLFLIHGETLIPISWGVAVPYVNTTVDVIKRSCGTECLSCFHSAGGSLPHSVRSGRTLPARWRADQASQSCPVHARGHPAAAEPAARAPQLTRWQPSPQRARTHTRSGRAASGLTLGTQPRGPPNILAEVYRKRGEGLGSPEIHAVFFSPLTLDTSCYMFNCMAVVLKRDVFFLSIALLQEL